MKGALRPAAVLVAAFSLSGLAFAEAPTAGTTPGTGARVIDLSTPQPAECLSEPTSGPWAVVAPYGWVPGIRGMVGAGQRNATVDVTVADAVDAAIKDLKGAAEIHVETGYGPFGVIADLMYIRLAPGIGITTVDSRSTIFELLGMYRVLDTGGRQAGGFTLDFLAGARYYRFSNRLEGNLFDLFAIERTNKWIDLLVGARAGVQVTDDLGIFARGDVGGFGIGHSSEQACNVIVGFEYRCCECASLAGGYRWLKIDRESGVGRDRFLFDATLSGPFVAFALRY